MLSVALKPFLRESSSISSPTHPWSVYFSKCLWNHHICCYWLNCVHLFHLSIRHVYVHGLRATLGLQKTTLHSVKLRYTAMFRTCQISAVYRGAVYRVWRYIEIGGISRLAVYREWRYIDGGISSLTSYRWRYIETGVISSAVYRGLTVSMYKLIMQLVFPSWTRWTSRTTNWRRRQMLSIYRSVNVWVCWICHTINWMIPPVWTCSLGCRVWWVPSLHFIHSTHGRYHVAATVYGGVLQTFSGRVTKLCLYGHVARLPAEDPAPRILSCRDARD